MKQLVIIAFAIPLFLTGCGGKKDRDAQRAEEAPTPPAEKAESAVSAPPIPEEPATRPPSETVPPAVEAPAEPERPVVLSADGTLSLRLNNGEKWVVDENTRAVVEGMVVKAAAGNDAKAIGASLQPDLIALLRDNPLDGETRHQFMAFLMAYMPAVEEAAVTGSPEALQRIRNLLSIYPEYFE